MITVAGENIYRQALRELTSFKREAGLEYRGRFVQIFLAMKFYQNELPSMFSNQYVATEVLQTLLDDLYAKTSRPLNDCVLMLFGNRYFARTGLTSLGNTTLQNTSRNNFNLQKGVGCYAPPQDLSSPTFLNQTRTECRYLQTVEPGRLAGATCQLSTSGARYRNEQHRKWLRIDPVGNGYSVVDLMNIANFAPYVAPDGMRIPAAPLVVALYHDCNPGLNLANRIEVDIPDFASDFNFSPEELVQYFDDDPANPHNRRLVDLVPGTTWMSAETLRRTTVRRTPANRGRARGREERLPRTPVLTGTPAQPPGVNTGWEAEQFVVLAMRAAGWTVHDVSRQKLGYDLIVQRGRVTKYVDVKSSLGLCAPTLTSREWQQATAHGDDYVLALLENFNPTGENVIFWVRNPATNCTASESRTIQHSISRSSWQLAVVLLDQI
jgi:hypothetical protein